uniref:U3 small nucleolar ribonucleoprotein protein MPP10 n=1 Tax=Leptobrachium leishanense TaxID=445787 RepID=A0A8C5M686_9ANUR
MRTLDSPGCQVSLFGVFRDTAPRPAEQKLAWKISPGTFSRQHQLPVGQSLPVHIRLHAVHVSWSCCKVQGREMESPALSSPDLGPCVEALEAVSAHPEQLLSVQEGLASQFTQLTKVLYDLHKSQLALEAGSPLKELVTDNFDEEQIWQQIELQNSTVLSYLKKVVRKNVNDKELSLVEPSEEEVSEAEVEDNISDLESGNEKVVRPKTSGRSTARALPDAPFSDDDSDLDFDIDKLEQQNRQKPNKTTERKKPSKKTLQKSVVDDQFFSLAEMESFLEAAEKENDGKDVDNDDEEVDYFVDVASEDEDLFDTEEIEQQETKSSRDLYYKDYFDPLDGEEEEGACQQAEEEDDETPDENEEDDHISEDVEEMSDYDDDDEEEPMEETEDGKKAKEAFKRVTFDLSDDSEGEDIFDILGGQKKQKEIEEPSELKSSFEKREEKMAEKIKSMQDQMLGEKSWQLTGEVTAQKRPENSLLSESLQFDHAVRMAPVITEETTVQLEDIIKQRIKDQVWDDVVRKEKPKENPFEFKKRLTLDHDKSKLSLAEVYEQEYLKLNQKSTEEEENPKHVEIQKMLDSLFLQLDALSNFHFIPKPAVPEIKVVSNVAAISMEEVAPVGISEAALLAPEEIKEKNKAGDIKAKAEKTETDKKRERRKKKTAKRMKMKEKEKHQKLAEKRREESGKKVSKQTAAANLKKLAKEGKATVLKDEGKDKALKSSQAFFSQLQDQVKLQIKGAKAPQKKAKRDHELSAHKLKL